MRDKVEGARVIPLTPCMAALLSMSPRRNEWVFSALPPPAPGPAEDVAYPNHRGLDP